MLQSSRPRPLVGSVQAACRIMGNMSYDFTGNRLVVRPDLNGNASLAMHILDVA